MDANERGNRGRDCRAEIRSLTLAATFLRVAMSVSEWTRMSAEKRTRPRKEIRSLTLAATFLRVAMSVSEWTPRRGSARRNW